MGSITKHKNGWRAFVSVNKKRKSKVFKTKRDATSWVMKMESEGLSSSQTVKQLLEKYRDEVSVHKRGEKWERDRIGLICRMEIANIRLDRLEARHITAWRDARLRQVSASSVRREWTLLNHAFNTAVREWQLLAINPMPGVKKPKEAPPRKRVISDEEVQKILHTCGYPGDTKTSRVGDVLLFALETAMRLSEITGLTWEHVHQKHVHIPKTKNGLARDVPLSTVAKEILSNQDDSNPVFGISTNSMEALFRKCKQRAILNDLHFHDTRRTALTRLSKKFNVMELAKISGHQDIRILQSTYYAPTVEDLADKLD